MQNQYSIFKKIMQKLNKLVSKNILICQN